MAAMKKLIVNCGITALIIGFSIWLYAFDQAAEPGALSSAHQFISDCKTCHVPWQGVTERMCLQCHYFEDVSVLKPQIRFHGARKHCLDCHNEHRGRGADISAVDHTIFNGELSCTQCHFEAHDNKFGDNCRACHGIRTWEIDGFRHPPREKRDCHRCHATPASHIETAFWDKILEGHSQGAYRVEKPMVKECWRCHTTHRWGHMMMGHDL